MWEVIVGNVGIVYDGSDERKAWDIYHDYIDQSRNVQSSCYHEPVILMENDEIHAEYLGENP